MDLTGKLIEGTGSYEIREIAPISESGEKVTNGGFDTDTVWNKQSAWTISGGKAIYDDSATQRIDQNVTFIAGNTYLIKFTIADLVSGTASFGFFNQSDSQLFGTAYETYANGTYTIIRTAIASSALRIYGNIASSGSWSLDNLSIQEVPRGYPIIDKGTKYLECTATGTVAFPSNQAYGEWEFDWLQGGASTELRIYFINNTHDKVYSTALAYMVYFTSGQQVTLYKSVPNDQLFASALSYFSDSTWYRCKITRTLDGEFSVYLRGGEFGNNDWTLAVAVSDTNPVTDNTHKISNYMVLDLDNTDKIANIVMRKAVQQ